MRTETRVKTKFNGEMKHPVIIETSGNDSLRPKTMNLSLLEAQELLLQLGDILMETQGHVQTGRPVSGSVPKKFIMDRK